jgi:hypothetical protein
MNDRIIYLTILAHGFNEYNSRPYTSDVEDEIIHAK